MTWENGTARTIAAIITIAAAAISGGAGSQWLKGPTVPQIVVDAMRQGFTEALIKKHTELEQCRSQLQEE